jgi:hypothetical protein
MPVTQDEARRYAAFLNRQGELLGAFDVKGQEVLWHYTTGSSLLKILDSGILYSTQVACLNDSTETLYGTRILLDAFEELLRGGEIQGDDRKFLQTYVSLRPGIERSFRSSQINSTWYVSCFSSVRDDLSQWRAYSSGEDGYAIGFHGHQLASGSPQDHLLARVSYDTVKLSQVASNIARALIEFLNEGLKKRTGEDASSWSIEFASKWDSYLSYLAPLAKDPAFEAESEYRLVRQYRQDLISELRFTHRGSLLLRHLPTAFVSPDTGKAILPIAEVMVGPSRNRDASKASLELLLRQKGYDNVVVTESKVPFQVI